MMAPQQCPPEAISSHSLLHPPHSQQNFLFKPTWLTPLPITFTGFPLLLGKGLLGLTPCFPQPASLTQLHPDSAMLVLSELLKSFIPPHISGHWHMLFPQPGVFHLHFHKLFRCQFKRHTLPKAFFEPSLKVTSFMNYFTPLLFPQANFTLAQLFIKIHLLCLTLWGRPCPLSKP